MNWIGRAIERIILHSRWLVAPFLLGLIVGLGALLYTFVLKLADFVTLPGVGRKTGNVVRSVWYGLPGLPVDTHVTRLTRKLRLTSATDPVKIEEDVCSIVPPSEWTGLSLRLILHGRRICIANKPRCHECVLADICPSAELGLAKPARAPRHREATAR